MTKSRYVQVLEGWDGESHYVDIDGVRVLTEPANPNWLGWPGSIPVYGRPPYQDAIAIAIEAKAVEREVGGGS